ncbi:MAG: hypothetical protein A2648_01055 [Candidatus Lloydbacteria bacterium RIFCSPHIGHO2_01_FULL_41_20]|uniref:Uncharacterized protein n=1 Tax=Candidatus Lloydbacteria bacterium RIFCSPHIGHO2_01_FULL_41_20 TaxID=1798657 RepID=A0A1G2CSV2_9BACT|nr:MAG: hypothetical protein A2648_01055 [Candidatus Lloydbacteria bacterium RIFCSPHIGHO2_01_FULL_41_20]
MEEEKPKKKSKFGVGFYIVLVFAIIKDISDIVFTAFVFTSPLTIVTGALMSMVLWAYFFFIGVSLNGRKLATFAITAIIEVIPLFGVLPMAAINLTAIRIMESASEKIPSALTVKK